MRILMGVVAVVLAGCKVETVAVATDATLLYYNGPAAVQSDGTTFVGFVDMTGAVKVAALGRGAVLQGESLVHQFATPDDHAAPALALSRDRHAEARLLVATAHHSSDLFVYRANDPAASSFRVACHLAGLFGYPRFASTTRGLSLFVRQEQAADDTTRNTRDLAVISIREDGSCGAPEVVVAAEPSTWIYATLPVVQGDLIHFGWSVYDPSVNLRGGAFAAAYDPATSMLDARALPIEQFANEVLVWSVSRDFAAVSHFSNAFSCCGTGELTQGLYDRRSGAAPAVALAGPSAALFYPSGFVLHPEGQDEVLEQAVGADGGVLHRRQAAQGQLGDALPSCPSEHWATLGQYVVGGGGSYVFVDVPDHYSGTDYRGASVRLCRVAH